MVARTDVCCHNQISKIRMLNALSCGCECFNSSYLVDPVTVNRMFHEVGIPLGHSDKVSWINGVSYPMAYFAQDPAQSNHFHDILAFWRLLVARVRRSQKGSGS